MLLSKLPSPPRPWPSRHFQVCSSPPRPILRLPARTIPRRRHLLLGAAPSSPDAPDASGGWKTVPPGMRECPGSKAAAAPPWPMRRRARGAWWKASSWLPRKARSVVLLNLITVVFASNIAVVKEAETILDPDLFNVVRFAISALPFVPFVPKALGDKQIAASGVELGFWVSLGYLTQAIGLVTADAGRASFISAFTVIIVPFLDGIFGAIVPVYTWLGASLSLVGVAMLEFSGSPPCVLVVSLMSAAWFILKRSLHNVQHWSLHLWSWTKFSELAASFPWLSILYTGIFSTGFCLWAELAAMRDVSATETAIIYGLEPVWGAAFAWIILGERWGIAGWLGAILIIGGSLMVQIRGSFSGVSKGDTIAK